MANEEKGAVEVLRKLRAELWVLSGRIGLKEEGLDAKNLWDSAIELAQNAALLIGEALSLSWHDDELEYRQFERSLGEVISLLRRVADLPHSALGQGDSTERLNLLLRIGREVERAHERHLTKASQILSMVGGVQRKLRAAGADASRSTTEILSGSLAVDSSGGQRLVVDVGDLKLTVSDAQKSLQQIEARSQSLLAEVQQSHEWFKKSAQTLQDAIAGKQDTDNIAAFTERAKEHAKMEGTYRQYFFLSLIAVAAVILYFLKSTIGEAYSMQMVILHVVKAGLLLGLSTALSRVFLRRWNLERNLRLLYEHRVAALKQYRLFDGSVTNDDRESKDRLRMAVAQMIFSDPRTGYVEDTGGDLSISPVVNVVEQLAKKGSSSTGP